MPQAAPRRCFHLRSGETNAAAIEGFTIRGGFSTYQIGGDGAGIRCDGASPTIRDCVIAENIVWGIQYDGGGIYLRASFARVEDCVVRNNHASYGGGIACRGEGAPVIARCFIHDNLAGYGGGIDAGGIGSPRIIDCVISGNAATEGFEDPGSGGGLLLGGSASVEGCTITGNLSGYGAGIACWSGSPRVIDSTIAGNDARLFYGGGIAANHSDLLVERSVLWGNCAAYGEEFLAGYQAAITFRRCVYDSTGATQDGGQVIGIENILADPLLCDPLPCGGAPSIEGDHRVARSSPCVPDGNPFGIWIGSQPVGCPAASSPEEASLARATGMLGAPHPNPTSAAVAVTINLPQPGAARLRLYDPAGRLVATLMDRELPAGLHRFEWMAPRAGGAPPLRSGSYLLRLEALGRVESRRLVVVR